MIELRKPEEIYKESLSLRKEVEKSLREIVCTYGKRKETKKIGVRYELSASKRGYYPSVRTHFGDLHNIIKLVVYENKDFVTLVDNEKCEFRLDNFPDYQISIYFHIYYKVINR